MMLCGTDTIPDSSEAADSDISGDKMTNAPLTSCYMTYPARLFTRTTSIRLVGPGAVDVTSSSSRLQATHRNAH